jgi:hypothetical protein
MQSFTLYVSWAIWVILVVINCVIFLNFIIAVISDVYAQVMETREESALQMKCQFIIEVLDASNHNNKSSGIIITRMKA